jgi:hypothetical protein
VGAAYEKRSLTHSSNIHPRASTSSWKRPSPALVDRLLHHRPWGKVVAVRPRLFRKRARRRRLLCGAELAGPWPGTVLSGALRLRARLSESVGLDGPFWFWQSGPEGAG